MSSDEYQVQNVYRYSRKSYKKNRRAEESGSPREDDIVVASTSSPRGAVRSNGMDHRSDSPGCSCEPDPEGDLASISHMKCAAISLAQQQLQRLLEETDKLLCDNTRCCRSIYDFLCICNVILSQNKGQCAILILLAAAFFIGLLFGAASCGTYLGHFNSPILSCIDSFFIPDTYPSIVQTFRSIT